MIRILLAGYGVRGRQWAEAVERSAEATLAAIVDVDPAAVGTTSALAFTDLTSALDAIHADAIILATPPHFHAQDVLTAGERGLAVLCEKPLAEDLDEAISVVEAMERRSVPLLVGMNFRFLPASEELRRLVRTRSLGDPMFGQFTYIRNRDGRRPDLNDYPLTMAQPMLVEQSIHHLDLLRYVYGREVRSVAADTWNPPTSVYRDDSCVAALLRFEDGLHVSYLGTWTSGTNRFDFRWRTDFEVGVVIQADQFGSLLTAKLIPEAAIRGPLFDTAAEPPEPLPVEPSAPFVQDTERLLAHFMRVVKGIEPPSPTGRDHLRTLVLLAACAESSATGRSVDLDSFARDRGIPMPSRRKMNTVRNARSSSA